MEVYCKKIFYAGISHGTYPEKGQRLKKTGLPLKKLDREFPYLLGEGRGNQGRLQIYFSLLPEYTGKTLLGGKPKVWKTEAAERLLFGAGERAYAYQDCTDRIIAMDIRKYEEALPIELWAIRLYQKRPFDSICISMTPDGGEQEVWRLAELLNPYLPRVKRVAFKGQRSLMSEQLGNYLYEEFGIIMMDTEKIPGDMLYLDFKNSYETLKFLDTAVKNGYNTEVN